jgi:D-tyrosyl-tRNA(Tyr) deacylase
VEPGGDRKRLPKQRPVKSNALMRAVIQRVSEASVTIAGQIRAAIQNGLVVLLAIEETDTPEDNEWLSGKIVRLRIFPDDNGVMNRSVQEVSGDVLLISQFTLFASTKKGNRPSYARAARPEIAIPLYEAFSRRLTEDLGKAVRTGEFGADMKVSLVNDGPVTIVIDSRDRE